MPQGRHQYGASVCAGIVGAGRHRDLSFFSFFSFFNPGIESEKPQVLGGTLISDLSFFSFFSYFSFFNPGTESEKPQARGGTVISDLSFFSLYILLIAQIFHTIFHKRDTLKVTE